MAFRWRADRGPLLKVSWADSLKAFALLHFFFQIICRSQQISMCCVEFAEFLLNTALAGARGCECCLAFHWIALEVTTKSNFQMIFDKKMSLILRIHDFILLMVKRTDI